MDGDNEKDWKAEAFFTLSSGDEFSVGFRCKNNVEDALENARGKAKAVIRSRVGSDFKLKTKVSLASNDVTIFKYAPDDHDAIIDAKRAILDDIDNLPDRKIVLVFKKRKTAKTE